MTTHDEARNVFRHPPGGNFAEESLTPDEIFAQSNTKPDVWSRAVRLRQQVCGATPGAELPADVRDVRAALAVEALVVDAQESAVTASAPDDETSLRSALAAALAADEANRHTAEAAEILHQPYPHPSGGIASGHDVVAAHRADTELGQDRQRAGDTRHNDRLFPRAVSVLVGVVLFALDVGVWTKWLGLGMPESASMVFKWVIAVVVATIMSLAVGWAVHRFADTDRTSTDRRGAATDYNREAERAVRAGTSLGPAPDLGAVVESDRERAHVLHQLIAVAGIAGGFLAIRIALVARESGQPVLTSGPIAVGIGLLLAFVVVGLGFMFCRGNSLGDRLRLGAETVEEIEDDLREATDLVVADHERARAQLTEAAQAATRAEAIRGEVVADAWEALLLGATWSGVPRHVLERPTVAQRHLETATTSAEIQRTVVKRLGLVDRWLLEHRPSATKALIAGSPDPAGSAIERYHARPVPAALVRGGIVSYRLALPRRPQSPVAWAIAAAIAVVVAGVVTAAVAPMPEGVEDAVRPSAMGTATVVRA